MNLDSLVRLIESADPMSFRSLVLEFLMLLGYNNVVLTDGPSDGGTDFSVYSLPPNPMPIAFQVSVEKNWKYKIKADAIKVRDKLNLNNLVYISSRRIPEIDFNPISNEIWRDYNVRVTKYDVQYIASTFFSNGKTKSVLTNLGIDLSRIGVTDQSKTFDRSDVAYSFAFFGKPVEQFRESLVESCLIAILAKSSVSLKRDQLEKQTVTYLGIETGQIRLVRSTFDRMLQDGNLKKEGEYYSLSSVLKDASEAMVVLKERQWEDLRNEIRNVLEIELGATGSIIEDVLVNIMNNVGALLLDTALDTVNSISDQYSKNSFGRLIKKRLQQFSSHLTSLGINDTQKRYRAIRSMADVVSKSPLANHILSGELFISLLSLRKSDFIKALGGKSQLIVMLDASVAIPMLCNLLYSPVQGKINKSCNQLYLQLNKHDISTVIPNVYLGEVIAHLIIAKRDYAAIINEDSDLIASENAFVAHFKALEKLGEVKLFNKYLSGFGLSGDMKIDDFNQARDRLFPAVGRMFNQYNIECRDLGKISAISLRRAQEDLMILMDRLRIKRPTIVVEHDSRVIAYLHEKSVDPSIAHILCTWDKLHHAITESRDVNWDTINPATLSDILSLIQTSSDMEICTSIPFIAQSLSDKDAKRGAAVWDNLIKIEKENFHDADLLQAAREFKKSYLEKKKSIPEYAEIEREWANWKQKHSLK